MQHLWDANKKTDSKGCSHSNSFDALRLVGALLVIVGHSYVLTGHAAPRLAGVELHILGVKVFFVVSGYLISESYRRDPNLIRFACRRALRIMPALIAVVILTATFGAILSTSSSYWSGAAYYVARNIMLLPFHELPGLFAGNPYPRAVNGSLWTIPVEVFMYAITPLLMIRKAWIIALIVAALLIPLETDVSVLGFGLNGATDLIPYFLLGLSAHHIMISRSLALASAAILAFATLCPLPEVAIAVPITCSALRLGMLQSIGLKHDLSYGLYLLAFPAQQTLIHLFNLEPPYLILATIIVCVPLAFLSWKAIEKPALRFKPRIPAREF